MDRNKRTVGKGGAWLCCCQIMSCLIPNMDKALRVGEVGGTRL